MERAVSLVGSCDLAAAMDFLRAVLRHQTARASHASVRAAAERVGSEALANRVTERFPLLELGASVEVVSEEVDAAVRTLTGPLVPEPLTVAGRYLVDLPGRERRDFIETWLDDTSLVEPRLALWIRIAAGPVLEQAASGLDPVGREEWTGRACPVCGDVPQCSAIVEESGGFMQGAPRYLICGRCATWWPFPRAVCPTCEEDDSRRQGPFIAEGCPWVRVDVCDTCAGYVKTFDLREAQARDVIPLVDDVATLTLDVWAHEKGLRRPGLSLAGV